LFLVKTKNELNRLIHEKGPYLLQHANNPVKYFFYTRIKAFLRRDLFPFCDSIRDFVIERSFETYFRSLERPFKKEKIASSGQ